MLRIRGAGREFMMAVSLHRFARHRFGGASPARQSRTGPTWNSLDRGTREGTTARTHWAHEARACRARRDRRGGPRGSLLLRSRDFAAKAL